MRNSVKDRKKTLDSYDRKILKILAVMGRISWRELAEKINLSHTPTLRRVRRLEDEGYITGYGAVINENLLHGTFSILVKITVRESCIVDFQDAILSIPQVIFLSRSDGPSEYLANVYSADINQTYKIIDLISSIPGVLRMTSQPIVKIVIRLDNGEKVAALSSLY